MKTTAAGAARAGVMAVHAAWITLWVLSCTVVSVSAEEGIVERSNVCRKGTLIIRTTDNTYVAALQAGIDDFGQTPWSDDSEPKCSFFTGERVNGDLSGYGTVTLANSSGRACDYVIEGSGFTMQDAEQILGCE